MPLGLELYRRYERQLVFIRSSRLQLQRRELQNNLLLRSQNGDVVISQWICMSSGLVCAKLSCQCFFNCHNDSQRKIKVSPVFLHHLSYSLKRISKCEISIPPPHGSILLTYLLQFRPFIYVLDGHLSSSTTSPFSSHKIPPRVNSKRKGRTLSGRFTVVNRSGKARDSILPFTSFIRKKNGWKQLDMDRSQLSISTVIMHRATEIYCCCT